MKKIFIYIGLIVCFLLPWQCVKAQRNSPVFGQHMMSRIHENPAAISVSNYIDAFLLGRAQWVGFEGAPKSALLNFQGFAESINSGFGASFVNDVFGNNYTMNIKFAYSYHFRVGEKMYLSLGLSAGALYKYYKGSNISGEEEDDPFLIRYDKHDIKPDVDFGLVFNSPSISVGVSATHLTGFFYQKKDDYFTPQLSYHAFFEYRGRISENFTLIPNLSATYVSDKIQAEFNLSAFIAKVFWVGASYRLSNDIAGMLGVKIKDFMNIGYVYEFGLGPVKGYNSGTHEIMLNFRIKAANELDDAVETPRFFE